MNEIFSKQAEEDYKRNGLKSLKEAIAIGPSPKIMKQAEEELKNYTDEYRNFKINIARISANVDSIMNLVSSNIIYDRKEDLSELGNMLIDEANKIIELGKGASK